MNKILLLGGSSTSIVVKKMKEAAASRGIEAQIEARELERFQDLLAEYDIFLLGPQDSFKQAEFAKIAATVGKRVGVINPVDYGMMKGDKILDFAIAQIG